MVHTITTGFIVSTKTVHLQHCTQNCAKIKPQVSTSDKLWKRKIFNRIEFPEQLYMDRYEYANRDVSRKAFQTRQTIEHGLFENDKAQIKLVNPGGNDVNIQKALNCINLLGKL